MSTTFPQEPAARLEALDAGGNLDHEPNEIS
jgi:hypothetical protein